MALTKNLMGTGIAAAPAGLLGFTLKAVTGAGTSQSSGPALERQSLNVLTTASSQTACTLPSPAQGSQVGDTVIVFTTTSTTGLVFPDTSASIDNGTATTGSVNVPQNKTRMFIRISPTAWISILTA